MYPYRPIPLLSHRSRHPSIFSHSALFHCRTLQNCYRLSPPLNPVAYHHDDTRHRFPQYPPSSLIPRPFPPIFLPALLRLRIVTPRPYIHRRAHAPTSVHQPQRLSAPPPIRHTICTPAAHVSNCIMFRFARRASTAGRPPPLQHMHRTLTLTVSLRFPRTHPAHGVCFIRLQQRFTPLLLVGALLGPRSVHRARAAQGDKGTLSPSAVEG